MGLRALKQERLAQGPRGLRPYIDKYLETPECDYIGHENLKFKEVKVYFLP